MTGPAEPRAHGADAFAASRGVHVEDLGWVADEQPWIHHGPRLSSAAIAMLSSAPGRSSVPLDDRTAAALAELVDAELSTPANVLTEVGRAVAQALAEPVARLRVEARSERTSRILELFLGVDQAVLVTSEAPTSGSVVLDVVELSWAGPAVASWLGLGPAWSFDLAPAVLPRDVVLARVDAAATPVPADADEALAAVWVEPWQLWGVRAHPSDEQVLMVCAGRRGLVAVADEPAGDPGSGLVSFVPLPSFAAFSGLIAMVERAYGAGLARREHSPR